jgi:hypothetical protein
MSPLAPFRSVVSALLGIAIVVIIGCGGAAAPDYAGSFKEGGTSATADASVDSGDAGGRTSIDAGIGDARLGDATISPPDATISAPDAAISAPDAATPAPDAPSCGPTTCATGCCDVGGRCVSGDLAGACGKAGQACQDCAVAGFSSCDATSHACYNNTLALCTTTNCKGCCVRNLCFAGTDSTNCGAGGQLCQSCSVDGLACTAQQCVKPSCGPGSCNGCCVGNTCLSGASATNCGQNGAQCVDCAAVGSTCAPSDAGGGGMCGVGTCNYTSCPGGCCDANGVCQVGTSSAACGGVGAACQGCPSGTLCLNKRCECTFQTCPSGCCMFSRGVAGASCAPGNSDSQCGVAGSLCQNCGSGGGTCTNQQCNLPSQPPPCLCSTGCCDSLGRCQPGASNAVCGLPGETCSDCTQSGTLCEDQQCTTVVGDSGVCNVQTCPTGCCDSAGACQQGLTNLACGTSGTNCQNCLSVPAVCSNQQCVPSPDAGLACNPGNCGGCCDSLGNCLGGFEGTQCGTGGRLCIDCMTTGTQCEFGLCTESDGSTICAQSCDGCCDAAGNCQVGFAATQCGELGGACQDCTSLSPPSTCDVVVSPRACTSKQAQCPALYPACPAALQELVPTRQKVCSASDLQNAAGACADGPYTAPCAAYLDIVGTPCSDCLVTFNYEFAEQEGIAACLAPFVNATCNHNDACMVDCVAESCFNCPDTPSTAQCETLAPSGTCSTFGQADACATQALAGAGAVCNPATYQGNFGAWFQAVGATYCGP